MSNSSDDQISGNLNGGQQRRFPEELFPNGHVPGGRSKLKQAREEKELAELLEEIDLEQEQESYEYDSDVSLEY
uniref:Uncharacterized protein n=1 Tax=Ditylenchus dipsaci TaxID=166011 RepID=A0A915DPU3_9BILA